MPETRTTGGTGQQAIWDYFQNQAPESFAHSRARLAFLVRLLPRGTRVLNVGVGAGAFEEMATARGLVVSSLDPSGAAVERLRQRFAMGDRARAGHAEAMPFPDRAFDAIVVSEVLEHLADETLPAVLGEIARVLVPGGRVLGTVPAREDLAEQMVVCPDCGRRFHRWGHAQSFDVARLRALLRPRFVAVRAWERPFVTWSALNWKGRAQGVARLLLHRLGIRGRQESIVFTARTPCT